MNTGLQLTINGRERVLEPLDSPTTLDIVLQHLEMRADRVAVERNGELAPRTLWSQTPVQTGDRLEIVHFVGGGGA